MENKTSKSEVDAKKEDEQPHISSSEYEGRVVSFTTLNQSRFHLMYVTVVLIVIILAVTGTLIYQHNHHSQLTSVCGNQSQLQSAQTELKNSANNQLAKTVSEIKKRSGYTSDPNCMYIITAYYYVILDYRDANASLRQLQVTDTSNVSTTLTSYKSVAQLAASIKTLSKFSHPSHILGQQPYIPSSSGGSK